MGAVSVKGVSKTFSSTGVKALDDVSLEIARGEIFGLLGPNGAGKTTLICILAGVTEHDAGDVFVLGEEMRAQRHDIQQELNMVRGFGGTLNKLTVNELLKYYSHLYNVPDTDARIAEVIRIAGLEERKDQAVSEFSSGWRQRFFIAKALLNKPKLLLLDEPTVGLDVDMAMHIRALIKRLKKEGYTILLTTHYMREAEELCDRIALISGGRIIAAGTTRELKELVRKDEAVEVRGKVSASKLRRIRGVLGVHEEGNGVRVLIEKKEVMKDIIKAVAGDDVTLVKLEEPTLEDVFLKLTRRGFKDEPEA